MPTGRKLNFVESTYDFATFRKILKTYTPTARELRRTVTTAELRELCLRIPCRVDLTRWNPVYDYQQHFQQSQRLLNKTSHNANALIVKAVKRYHDENLMPTAEQIRSIRAEEWQWRKREHLMYLRYWRHQRHEANVQKFIAAYMAKLAPPSSKPEPKKF